MKKLFFFIGLFFSFISNVFAYDPVACGWYYAPYSESILKIESECISQGQMVMKIDQGSRRLTRICPNIRGTLELEGWINDQCVYSLVCPEGFSAEYVNAIRTCVPDNACGPCEKMGESGSCERDPNIIDVGGMCGGASTSGDSSTSGSSTTTTTTTSGGSTTTTTTSGGSSGGSTSSTSGGSTSGGSTSGDSGDDGNCPPGFYSDGGLCYPSEAECSAGLVKFEGLCVSPCPVNTFRVNAFRCDCSYGVAENGETCLGPNTSSSTSGSTSSTSSGTTSGSTSSTSSTSGTTGTSGDDPSKCDPNTEVCGGGGGETSEQDIKFERPQIPEFKYSDAFNAFSSSVSSAPILQVPSFSCSGGAGTCPAFTFSVLGNSFSTDIHCGLIDTVKPMFNSALMLFGMIIAVRVILSA